MNISAGLIPKMLEDIITPGYKNHINSHMCLNQKFTAESLSGEKPSLSPFCSIIGAEKIAPPGIGSKPIIEGNIIKNALPPPKASSKSFVIKSSLPDIFNKPENASIKNTTTTREIVSNAMMLFLRIVGINDKSVSKNRNIRTDPKNIAIARGNLNLMDRAIIRNIITSLSIAGIGNGIIGFLTL